MATNVGTTAPKGRAKKVGPFLKVKSGSAVVPIYRTESKGRIRYTLSFYRDGRRMRKMFSSIDEAKKEALYHLNNYLVGIVKVCNSHACPDRVKKSINKE